MFGDGKSVDQKILEAIKVLREYGYRVQAPLLEKRNVSNTKQLVTFFYDTMARYKSVPIKIACNHNIPKDLLIAKRFVEARMATGVGKEAALAESCEIIEVLFKYEEKLSLKFPITSMNVLTSNSLSWIVESVIGICNNLNEQVKESDSERWFEKFTEHQKNSDISSESHRTVLDELDRMLKKNGTSKEKKE